LRVNQDNGDTVPSLAKALAAYETDLEGSLGHLEKKGFVSRREGADGLIEFELTEVGRDYLIKHDMYRTRLLDQARYVSNPSAVES
jgi:DNA-binding MarR family transcriptional regulator